MYSIRIKILSLVTFKSSLYIHFENCIRRKSKSRKCRPIPTSAKLRWGLKHDPVFDF